MRSKPLDGIRVLDLTRLLPGPMCTLHLADMGADVIKVEDPWPGDYAREIGGSGDGPSPFFRCINRNKRGLRLDLKQPQGRRIFKALARTADVLVEGFRPGVLERLGLGYDTLNELNRRIVYCAITGYGQTGPYRQRAGHDINYCGYAGIFGSDNASGEAAALPDFQIADLAGGTLSAAMGILAALVDVQRSGQGRYIDVSMTDCVLSHAITPFAAMLAGQKSRPNVRELLTGTLPCYGMYRTSDNRYMALGALELKYWQAFCEAVERPDLVSRHILHGREAEKVRAEVAAIFESQTRAYWVEKLQNVDCCASPVLTMEEAVADPHLRERGTVVQTEQSGAPPLTQLAFPVKFSDFEFSIDRAAPAPGEHTAELLMELGYSDERINELAKRRVI